MARPALLTAAVLVAMVATAPAQSLDDSKLRVALAEALGPALPFPPARADGTPEAGGAEPVWTVRWAEDPEPRVEVLANPFNEDNRERALVAEQAIQKAAMQAQRQSQTDYERALTDFQRTGRTSEIREISLRDDGVAGERYDAESQLTVTAEVIDASRTFTVAGAAPHILAAAPGTSAVVRVPANTYVEDGPEGTPGTPRYGPEQAWVLVGGLEPRVRSDLPRPSSDVTVSVPPGAAGVLVWIRGNADLVEKVVTEGQWSALLARIGG